MEGRLRIRRSGSRKFQAPWMEKEEKKKKDTHVTDTLRDRVGKTVSVLVHELVVTFEDVRLVGRRQAASSIISSLGSSST